MRRMGVADLRVLHLIDTGGPGGAETVCLNLARGLQGRVAHQTIVVPERDWLYEELVANGMSPLVRSTRPGGFDLGYAAWLRRLVKTEGIGLIQTHLLGSATYGAITGLMTRVPSVCTFHGTPDFSGSSWLLALKLRMIAHPMNRVVCVSTALRRFLELHHGVPLERSSTIYNGVDFSDRHRHQSETGARPVDGDLILGAVGNVRPAKDYPTLLQALAQVRDKGVDASLLVMGQASDRALADLNAVADRLGVSPFVHFLGFRPDARSVLASCDVFVSSSSSEGFSLATVEAMSLGLPVVVTRSGGPEEIVSHDRTGLLVPTANPAAIAEAVTRLWRNPELARTLGRAGEEHARKAFSVESMVAAYLSTYDSCVN